MLDVVTFTPAHEHDCTECRYYGTFPGTVPHDIYTCGESVVIRHDSDGAEYDSFPMSIAREVAKMKSGTDYARALALIDSQA